MAERGQQLRSLSIVSPFYNEEGGLGQFYQQLSETLAGLDLTVEFIFVDDGSGDGTLEALNRLAAADPRITVLSLTRNFGHQAALTAGLDYARGDAVVTMDSDLQHPPEMIPRMIAEFERGSDIVNAVRGSSQGLGLVKRSTTALFYWLIERTADVKMVRGAADFRLMSRRSVEALREMRESNRYLRGMVSWLGFPFSVVPYEQPARASGRAKYTAAKSLRLARQGLFSFSTIPLELVTWLGVALTGLGFLYLMYILAVVARGQAVAGWASVIVAVLVIGGVQLISLGILAQYMGMLFEQSRNRPLYVLKQERLGRVVDRGSPDS